jgi:4-oxalocrotonate tautomerase
VSRREARRRPETKVTEKAMPIARIDLIKGKSPEYRRTIGDVVYQAMVDILKAPKGERFQVIAEHDANDFIYDPAFWGIERSPDQVFIQLTLVANRTLQQKREFYTKVVDDLNERLGLRREDVMINLVGTTIEDWSFGNGASSLVEAAAATRSGQ